MEDYREFVKSSMQKRMLSSVPSTQQQQQHRLTVIQKLRRVDDKFSMLVRALLLIGSNLSVMKELRDFWIDTLEKFGDVLHKHIRFSHAEIFAFCDCLIDSLCELKVMEFRENLIHINAWSSFMCAVRDITTRMYNAEFQGEVHS